jgi:hypothetical protein
MRNNRLQLVGPENNPKTTTDVPTELSAAPAMPDAVMRQLRLVEADDGGPPDDAA